MDEVPSYLLAELHILQDIVQGRKKLWCEARFDDSEVSEVICDWWTGILDGFDTLFECRWCHFEGRFLWLKRVYYRVVVVLLSF